MIFPERTRESHGQSDEHWNRFKGGTGETYERRGGVHMDFPELIDTIVNWTVKYISVFDELFDTLNSWNPILGVSTWPKLKEIKGSKTWDFDLVLIMNQHSREIINSQNT